MIYLDNAATTKPFDEAIREVQALYSDECFGNPNSIHSIGIKAKKKIEHARELTARFMGTTPDNVIFTSGGTEANNLAIFSALESMKSNGKTHIISSRAEHDSVRRTIEILAQRYGFSVTWVSPSGLCPIGAGDIKKEITPDTGLVSIMYINNETGVVNDVYNIARLCKKKKILYHSDCVQAAGCIPLSKPFGNFRTISAHKLGGIKGTGALAFCDVPLVPLNIGGENQEGGFRSGTQNVDGIVAMGKACEIFNNSSFKEIQKRIKETKELFYSCIDDSNGKLISIDGSNIKPDDNSEFSSKIGLVYCGGIDAQTFVMYLSHKGVYVSAGSACHEFSNNPSETLLAYGYTEEEARSMIRISFGNHGESDEQIRLAAETMKNSAHVLCLSKLYSETGGNGATKRLTNSL